MTCKSTRSGRKRARLSRRRSRGFSLVEMLISISILFVAMGAIHSTILSCRMMRQITADKALARNQAEQVFSIIRSRPGIVDAYDGFGGGSSGETFSIQGLADPSPTEPSGRVIVWRLKSSLTNSVTPPQPDPGSGLTLSQDEILDAQAAFANAFPAELDTVGGMVGTGWNDYIDTNGDGFVNALDDPRIMPVTIRIRWRAQSGMATKYFSTIIGRR